VVGRHQHADSVQHSCQLLSCLSICVSTVPQLHFELPLLLSDGEVGSPILEIWAWQEPLAATISGDREKAAALVKKLVKQTRDLCEERGVDVHEGKSPWESSVCQRCVVCRVLLSAALHMCHKCHNNAQHSLQQQHLPQAGLGCYCDSTVQHTSWFQAPCYRLSKSMMCAVLLYLVQPDATHTFNFC